MSYTKYSVEDFLTNEDFKNYCSGNDPSAAGFKNNVLKKSPEIEPVFTEAERWYALLAADQGNLSEQKKQLKDRILREGNSDSSSKGRNLYLKLFAAAAAMVLISASVYYIYSRNNQVEVARQNSIESHQNDIDPGGDKAILTLSDGSTVILDSAANGTLARQGNVDLLNFKGLLQYESSKAKHKELLYNTVSTPRGGQYQLILEDGTQVWLNAGSSLRFPTAFTGYERRVELTGEGYFEVAPNSAMPFIVSLPSKVSSEPPGEIRVLGTSFNINAYEDELLTKTTVLEGSVKYSIGNSSAILKQDQQARADRKSGISVSNNIDTEAVVAWKNGHFNFGEAMDIDMVMRQLARWYTIEIDYKETIKGKIGGSISRDVKISRVLEMLEMTGALKFQVEGNKITVMRKEMKK